jgi:hypothetical protein
MTTALSPRLLRALTGLALFGLIAAGPSAAAFASGSADYFRVVEVAGSQSLSLRSGPSSAATIVVDLPFDARGLRPTGVRERGWVQLTVVTAAREEFTGWARLGEVLPDDGYAPTVYRIVDAGSYGAAVKSENGWGSVVGTIPSGARGVLAVGTCEDGFCPIRYVGKKRRIEGWVSASYLAVAGGGGDSADDYSNAAPSEAPAYAQGLLSDDDREMVAALRDADGTTTYPTRHKRGLWWRLTHAEH